MTLKERVVNALEAKDQSDLDTLLSRCYYEGAAEGVAHTCDVYDEKIAEMQKTAEGMRYHNLAKSFIDYDLSKVEGYKGTAQQKLLSTKRLIRAATKSPRIHSWMICLSLIRHAILPTGLDAKDSRMLFRTCI